MVNLPRDIYGIFIFLDWKPIRLALVENCNREGGLSTPRIEEGDREGAGEGTCPSVATGSNTTEGRIRALRLNYHKEIVPFFLC